MSPPRPQPPPQRSMGNKFTTRSAIPPQTCSQMLPHPKGSPTILTHVPLWVPSLKKKISHLPSLLSRLLLLPHPQSGSLPQVGARGGRHRLRGRPAILRPPARSSRSSSAPLPPGSCLRPHRPRPRAGLAPRPPLPKPPSQKQVSPYPNSGRRQARQRRLSRDSELREKCWEIWRQGYAQRCGRGLRF